MPCINCDKNDCCQNKCVRERRPDKAKSIDEVKKKVKPDVLDGAKEKAREILKEMEDKE